VGVTLTRGFWAGKYEVTQGDWRRVVGELPGPLPKELPEGDEYPVGNVNFAEAEAFCRYWGSGHGGEKRADRWPLTRRPAARTSRGPGRRSGGGRHKGARGGGSGG